MNNRAEVNIEDLLDRIAALEIHNEELSKEVKFLSAEVQQVTRSHRERKPVKGRSVAGERQNKGYPADEHQRAREGIHLDRYERRLSIGDQVRILTAGAHTDRSKQGVINGFDDYRNRAYILDEVGTTQERAPKNLKKLN